MSGHDFEPSLAQYIESQRVMTTMGRSAVRRITHLSPAQVFVLAFIPGFFISIGGLFSILVASAVRTPGPPRLLKGRSLPHPCKRRACRERS